MITLAADVGGTFTDLVLVDTTSGRVLVDKVPSGARGRAAAIAPGIERLCRAAGHTVSDVGLFVHGFTVPTNAFLMRAGAKVALVTTAGAGDVLEIGNQLRPKTYALIQSKPKPVVERCNVVEVAERVDAFGAIVEPLSQREIQRCINQLRTIEPEAVALSLHFSFLAPAHEEKLASALREALPDIPVYASHVVNPQLEEWPRASTTAMAAYVGPVVARYLDELESTLKGLGFKGTLRLMRSDGGVATPRAARENPGHMLTSGLAGGVIAAVDLCRRLGISEAVTIDVGGTSADFSAITAGEAKTRMSRTLDGQPIRLPTIDVETMSNGGGSIAWVDAGGGLRVGPMSAGAVPGPACYGMGGEEPTVTDAAVVLGWLAAEDYLGGEVQLDADKAAEAIERTIANPLGLGRHEAAFGIIRVANAQLVQSIRTLCVERGLDPRRMTLIPFGGAGPLYAGMIARDLGMRRIVVPRHPGVFAAEGLLAADIRHILQTPFRAPLDRVQPQDIEARLGDLKTRLADELETDGVTPDRRAYRFMADLRYIGQFHEIVMAIPDYLGERYDAAELSAAFHRQHEQSYGHADPAAPVEIVNLRAEAVGRLDTPDLASHAAEATEPCRPPASRMVYFGARGELAQVIARATLASGSRVAGPAILTQKDSTIVLAPGDVAEVRVGGEIVVSGASP
ncbi:MAG: hydantoinase/oxoprolinase family protein [Hyphomicrobiaceae bacterium]